MSILVAHLWQSISCPAASDGDLVTKQDLPSAVVVHNNAVEVDQVPISISWHTVPRTTELEITCVGLEHIQFLEIEEIDVVALPFDVVSVPPILTQSGTETSRAGRSHETATAID